MSQGGTQVKKEITKLVADFAKNSQRFSASVVSEGNKLLSPFTRRLLAVRLFRHLRRDLRSHVQ